MLVLRIFAYDNVLNDYNLLLSAVIAFQFSMIFLGSLISLLEHLSYLSISAVLQYKDCVPWLVFSTLLQLLAQLLPSSAFFWDEHLLILRYGQTLVSFELFMTVDALRVSSSSMILLILFQRNLMARWVSFLLEQYFQLLLSYTQIAELRLFMDSQKKWLSTFCESLYSKAPIFFKLVSLTFSISLLILSCSKTKASFILFNFSSIFASIAAKNFQVSGPKISLLICSFSQFHCSDMLFILAVTRSICLAIQFYTHSMLQITPNFYQSNERTVAGLCQSYLQDTFGLEDSQLQESMFGERGTALQVLETLMGQRKVIRSPMLRELSILESSFSLLSMFSV